MSFNFYDYVRDGIPKSRLEETDKEFEARMMAGIDGEMRPLTGRSDRAFIELAERAGGVTMRDDFE